jgi:PAS domain S-box-containing protein
MQNRKSMGAPSAKHMAAWIRSFPAIAALFVVAHGFAVLIGWGYNLTWLRSPAPNFGSMIPGSAAASAVLGLALLVGLARARVSTRAVCWALELAVFAVGVAALAEYAFGIDLPIDRWPAPPALDALRVEPARMSVLEAVCFVLLPCALAIDRMADARGRMAARIVATCVGIAGLLTALGYVYGAPPLYQPFAATSATSLQAAVVFIVLAAAILMLHPGSGLASIATGPSLVGFHTRWFLPTVVLVPLLIGILAVQAYQSFGGARLSIAITAGGTTIAIGLIVALAAFRLRNLEDRLALRNRALAATSQGVFIADGDEHTLPIIYVNEAFTRLTGYSERDARGRRCDFLVSATPDDPALAQLQSALAERANITVTLPSKRRDGTVFSARWSVSTVPGSEGHSHLVGLLEDVTAEQLAAMARLELLAEASQARKDAESANRVKDVFFASITHELRSPLNACTMWLDVLALGPQSEKSAKGIDAIKRNLKLQTRLVNDLIDAAKISAGGIEIHRESHELEKLIEAHLETWRLLAAARNVQFVCQLPDQRHRLSVDAERLLQVLNNLLDNAFAHTPAGGRVELRVREYDQGIAIEVEDTGSGLSAEDLGRVFTPFWRAGSPKAAHKGLGLGLAIAENLIQSHGGSLRAQSPGLGMGCVFIIQLPIEGDAAAPPRAALSEKSR